MIFGSTLPKLTTELPHGTSREVIGHSTLGTADTIQRMKDLVTHGKRDQRIREAVAKIIEYCPQKNYECYAKEIFNFCRDKIKYTYDPVGIEYIQSPYAILKSGIADCDCKCILLAAMCESIGLPCEFVTIKADPSQPGEYSHVYVRVRLPGTKGSPPRIAGMDATMPGKSFGWQPPKHYPEKTWPASNDQYPSQRDATMYGLAEGPIPGIVEFDADVQSPGGDYRQIVQAEYIQDGWNQVITSNGLSAFGETSDELSMQMVWMVYTGEYAPVMDKKISDFKSRRSRYQGVAKKANESSDPEIRRLSQYAGQELAKEEQSLRKAIDSYNQIYNYVSKYASWLPYYGAKSISTLGALPILPFAVGATILGAGYLLYISIEAVGNTAEKSSSAIKNLEGVLGKSVPIAESMASSIKWIVAGGIFASAIYALIKLKKPIARAAKA